MPDLGDLVENIKVELPKTTKSRLAIFDLDETLIHSVDDIMKEKYQFLVRMNESEKGPISNHNSIGFNIRPFA